MSKAKEFLNSLKIEQANEANALESLAAELKEEGDDSLQNELESGNNTSEGLLALAYAMHLNGDDRLWNEIGAAQLIKESAEAAEKIEKLKKKDFSETKAGKFLSDLA